MPVLQQNNHLSGSTYSRKTVLISGASSGLGFATAKLLSEFGYRVFGTTRDPSKARYLPPAVEMLELDVNSDQSVNSCIRKLFHETDDRLDVLVNNAGFVLHGAVEEASLEEAKSQFETNLFGILRLIRAVLPTMRRQGGGIIINIGSLAGHVALPFQGYYAASKFALEGLTESLRHELKSLGIKVSIVEPGFFKTNIGKAAVEIAASISDYDRVRNSVGKTISKQEQSGQDPILVAKTVMKIIESEKPQLHYAVGREKYGLVAKRILPQSAFENMVRRMYHLGK